MVVINFEEKMYEAVEKWNKTDRDDKNKAEYSRYNGGWVKKITGLDKSKTNGYSLLGSFVKTGDYKSNYETGVYLDCSKDGSRKNQTLSYHLFKITESGDIEIIHCLHNVGFNYAVEFWEFIENEIGGEEVATSTMRVENILCIYECCHNLMYSLKDSRDNNRRQVAALENITRIFKNSKSGEKEVFADIIASILQGNEPEKDKEILKNFCENFKG